MNQRHLQPLLLLFTLSLVTGLASAEQAKAQQPGNRQEAAADNQGHDPWSYGSSVVKAKKMTIAQQKSQVRGQQRMARLAARRWYGFSGTRPTVSGIPFTSSTYGPTWRHPRFVWHTPIIVIQRPHAEPEYR